jgi:bisphosphoglycerate-independent phosphoglycerate mutase (AlkP superfamily)
LRRRISLLHILPPLIVDVFEVESVNMTRQITQQSKKNVDAQINPASLDEEHSKGRNEDLRTGQTGASEGGLVR